MYAIIETGGKQFRVETGDIIDVELLEETEDGKIEFKNVLFLSKDSQIQVGAPCIANSLVKAEIQGMVKGEKVIAFKYKRRKGIRRKVGHRQKYSRVKIIEIVG